ncbi:cell wall-binding repeat-containing protein [Herbiconiux sp. VKM Ac-1786]|uniref:cell wall-binding repeat-containing protein n=1 Tax=Herbiconiux sp. VKM Ac-1786 TaxID=2783824 RepID=UPI00188BCC86|nr:cell wall-binding repeat-containing protein [Herbiconiux sp. VKM Ac-1786]
MHLRARRPRVRRAGVLGTLTVAALAAGTLLGAPVAAGADEQPAPAPVAPAPAPADRPVMPDLPLESYTAAAAELPPELVEALSADLGSTPEEYLANADAAAAATQVVDALTLEGVAVASSRLEGTRLVVTVESAADVPAVEAANAVAEVGSAPGRDRYAGTELESFADLVGGQGYYFADSTGGYACSTAFNGIDRASGQARFVTAGHCSLPGDDGRVDQIIESHPNDPNGRLGARLGQQVAGSFRFGGEFDGGLVDTASGWDSRGVVGTYNSGANNGPVTSGASQPVRDYGDAIEGQSLCKSGRTTGWSCGTVDAVDQLIPVSGEKVNVDIVRGLCSDHGDSGGAVVSGPYALGLISGGTADSCTPSGVTAVFPMIGGSEGDQPYGSIVTLATNWWLKVEAPRPLVNAVTAVGKPITGTLPGGTGNYAVTISVDGGPSYLADVFDNRSWNVSVAGLTPGAHSYTAYSTFGPDDAQSRSASVSGTLFVGDVQRIAGADRFEGAVKVAQASFPTTAPVVYVATGLNYPDALSAAPAAVAEGGPLLLVTPTAVPAAVADEIRALAPQRIVVVGGTTAVSAAVVSTLRGLVDGVTVERLSGADRYEASRAVVAAVFDEATHAYAATGGNFPDALSAGGAAGSALEPVVLVNGGAKAADAPTLSLLRSLTTTSITVVGGPNSVSEGVKTSLGAVPASVDRVSAADRYQTSIALNRSAFTASDTVYLATGTNFPDALAGAVLAGTSDAPLYVVPGDCVPQGVLADVKTLGATRIVLFGGVNALSPAVAALAPCGF